jgi:hypothetical protein
MEVGSTVNFTILAGGAALRWMAPEGPFAAGGGGGKDGVCAAARMTRIALAIRLLAIRILENIL